MKNLTQEDVAEYLGLTPQSISKWERGECYPDIMLLPALANIFETSVDLLIGMDTIRAQETRLSIHKKASEFQRSGDYVSAEKVYRDALLIYPNKPGMMLGLAGVLALQNRGSNRADGTWVANIHKRKAKGNNARYPLLFVSEMRKNGKSKCACL